MSSKSVTQFLRSLDLSGVDFGSASQHALANTPKDAVRLSRKNAILTAASSVFPSTTAIENMCRLESLKLRNTELSDGDLPAELKNLVRLEYLSLAKNKLTHLTAITSWPKVFPNLRVLNCRKNNLSQRDSIPDEIFECPNLQVVDFSCNELTTVPRGIVNASSLLVLNLSENKLTSVPPELFVQCTQLLLLDLSDNQLDSLPAHLRRCSSLQQLILNRNPLQHYQLRTVSAIKRLEVLHLSGTQRSLENIPSELDRLEKLSDLDISDNLLLRIPEPIFHLRSLRKLDVSHNSITELSTLTDNWPVLEHLNLSHNQLVNLPAGLTRLTKLRKLYVNNNQLNFAGIPAGIGKLNDLEVFDASDNQLENIPEGLCRCGRLKRLLLSSNRLVTLPDAIHFLIENLEKFDVDDNPKLKFPTKPPILQKGTGNAFYNIDFSLDAQLQQLRGQPAEPNSELKQAKDTAARLRRLRRRRLDGGENKEDSNAVLAGMRHVANEKEAIMQRRRESISDEDKQVSSKHWKEGLARPNLDYSEIFDEEAGSSYGVEIWVIDEFCPRRYDITEFQGSLFDGDCYIVLETSPVESSSAGRACEWKIFYWIGQNTTLDKRACSAVHAVNLRNLLGAEGQTIREEQNDESKEFLSLFGGSITVLEGAQGYTGFLHVESKDVVVKLYRLFGQEKVMHIISMPVHPISLDSKFVYILDGNSKIYLWLGSKSRSLIQTRGRLLAERIAQKERLNEAEILLETEGHESNEFWTVLTGVWIPPPLLRENLTGMDPPYNNSNMAPPEVARVAMEEERHAHKQRILNSYPKPPLLSKYPDPAKDFIPVDWTPPKPIVYDVKLGKGFLELPQVELTSGKLTRDVLNSSCVYLVDSGGELFVWMGKKSAKFLRYAGFKLAEELVDIMPRGCFGGAEDLIISGFAELGSLAPKRPPPQLCPEGAECEIFRVHFVGWEPAVAVDFTRTAQSIAERGSDLNVIMERDKMKTDLRALLAPREKALGWDESMQLLHDLNQELVEPIDEDSGFVDGSPSPSLQQFIILDGKWVPVDNKWFGHFFNKDCYIVIARYWDDDDLSDGDGGLQDDSNSARPSSRDKESSIEPEDETAAIEEDSTKAVVYFWQGREASDLFWLTFNFSLRKDMEERLSRNPRANGRPLSVEFKRVRQQQEDMYFLAHFMRRMVIHSGYYRERDSQTSLDKVHLYHLRMNGNPIATRCVEITPTCNALNSCFSYICYIPAIQASQEHSQVFIWVGNKSPGGDEDILKAICRQIYDPSSSQVSTITEGCESDAFWNALGGRCDYDTVADYTQHSRLFRLSNDAGYFSASEKCADFCQDDLINEDVMMLDTGEQIYVWLGKRTSDVEVKLSLQAAKLYKEHMSRAQPNNPRQLKITAKNAEPFMFRRTFHGWGPFYEPKDWSG